MKNRYYLQLFAEGEGSGAAGEPAEDGAGITATGEGTKNNEPMSFDDFLANGGQAEFDRRVQKAIQTAVSNAQRKWQTLTDDKVSEAEKLSQMTAEQKEKYRADKAEKELADLRRQIVLDDMAKTARKMLSDEQIALPDEIIMNLVSDDAEKTKEAVEGFAKAFKETVNAAVKDALRGEPPKAGTGAKSITRADIMNVKNRAERQRLINENMDLFQK